MFPIDDLLPQLNRFDDGLIVGSKALWKRVFIVRAALDEVTAFVALDDASHRVSNVTIVASRKRDDPVDLLVLHSVILGHGSPTLGWWAQR